MELLNRIQTGKKFEKLFKLTIMNFSYKNITILFLLIISASCVKEKMIEVNPDFIITFQRDGKTDALAGNAFYVIPTGSGEFLTLFEGTEGRVWGEPGAQGTFFNKADSLPVQYSTAGKYNLSLVSTSAGSFGKEVSRKVKTVEVNVIDERNTITLFNINGVDGMIAANNDITFTVPDIVTDFNFAPTFVLQSPLAKAYVNGVEQTSATTVNDFSLPVVYTVKSAQGNEIQYTVKFTTFPASGEKLLSKFTLGIGGNGEVAVVDETNKTISLTANYGTNLKAVRLVLASSYGSKMYLGTPYAGYSDRKGYDLTAAGTKTIKVVAQNNTEAIYTIVIATDAAVSSFTFAGLVPAPVGVIDVAAKTITVDVLKGTEITKLVAEWTGSVGTVKIGSVSQSNGVTTNNFTSPVTYTFFKGTTAGDKYVVTVNVK
jgi:hypothetical protein